MWVKHYTKKNTFMVPISTLTVLEYILNMLDAKESIVSVNVKMWSGYLSPWHLKPHAIEEVFVGNGVLGSASQWTPQIILHIHKIIWTMYIFSIEAAAPTFSNQGDLMHSISISKKNFPMCHLCVCMFFEILKIPYSPTYERSLWPSSQSYNYPTFTVCILHWL